MASTYLSKKAFRTLEVMTELGIDNLCTSDQAEIAQQTGYSIRHQRRAIRELEEKGLIDTITRRVANGKRNVYRLKTYPQPDKKSPHPPQGTGQKESAPPPARASYPQEPDKKSPHPPQGTGQKESAPPPARVSYPQEPDKKSPHPPLLARTHAMCPF